MIKDANYDKSKYELQMQGKWLKEVHDILIKHDIKPVLSDGVVLGIVREHDFVKWDFDADMFVESQAVMGKEDALVKDFQKAGFIVVKVRHGIDDWKVAVEKEWYHIDVRAFKRVGDMHINTVITDNERYSVYQMPCRFMDNLQEVTFYDTKYFIPEDADGYLTHLYGDWRTPVRSCSHNVYLNTAFKQNYKMINGEWVFYDKSMDAKRLNAKQARKDIKRRKGLK